MSRDYKYQITCEQSQFFVFDNGLLSPFYFQFTNELPPAILLERGGWWCAWAYVWIGNIELKTGHCQSKKSRKYEKLKNRTPAHASTFDQQRLTLQKFQFVFCCMDTMANFYCREPLSLVTSDSKSPSSCLVHAWKCVVQKTQLFVQSGSLVDSLCHCTLVTEIFENRKWIFLRFANDLNGGAHVCVDFAAVSSNDISEVARYLYP